MEKFKAKPIVFSWRDDNEEMVEFVIRVENGNGEKVSQKVVDPGKNRTKIEFPQEGDGIYRLAIKSRVFESRNESRFARTDWFKWGNVPDIEPPFDLRITQE